jgi:hypothetical protein
MIEIFVVVFFYLLGMVSSYLFYKAKIERLERAVKSLETALYCASNTITEQYEEMAAILMENSVLEGKSIN